MKKNLTLFFKALLVFVCFFCQSAHATERVFEFRGTITTSNIGGFPEGTPFVARLSYDDAQAPTGSGSTFAYYSSFSFTLTLTGLNFSTNPANHRLTVENVLSGSVDRLAYRSILSCGEAFDLLLTDIAGSAFNSANLPSSLTLADFELAEVRFYTDGCDPLSTHWDATITSITSCMPNPVVTTNSDAGPGSLRQAILDACSGSTITFDPSLNGQTITLASTLPVIDKNLTISGPGANLLTISGNDAVQIFNINTPTVTISGLTMANGNDQGDYGGGAIYVGGTGDLTVSNSTFLNNNSSNDGGAIFIFSSATAQLLTVTGCTFSGNTASSVDADFQRYGGAIYSGAMCNISNSTFTGNSADFNGGAILLARSGSITNCTITGNAVSFPNSGNKGGGVFAYCCNNFTISNSIIAGNTSAGSDPDIMGVFSTTNNNIIGIADASVTGFTNGTNGNQVGTLANPVNPLLAALADNGGSTHTMALLAGSPAIDAGTNTNAPPADQRGFARVGTVDIGAYEVQTFPTNTSITSDINPSCIGTAVTFTATVTSNGNPVTGGTVSFTEGNTILAANVAMNNLGQASFITSSLTASAHNITATYNAAGIFETSNQSITQTVDAPATPVINGTLSICNGGGTTLSTAAVANGTYCWNSTTEAPAWQYVGSPGFSGPNVNYSSLAIAGNTPYVAYMDIDADSRTTVMKFDGSNWVYAGAPAFSGPAAYQNLAADGGTPYVTFRDATNGSKNTVMKFDGTNWVNVGVPGFSDGVSLEPNFAFLGGIPYVTYSDNAYGNKIVVKKFDGINWINVGSPGFSSGFSRSPKLAFSGGTAYVAFRNENTQVIVMKFDGTNWVNVGGAASSGLGDQPSLAFDGSTPYVAFRDHANDSKTTVMKFDGTNWVSVGLPGFSAGQGLYQSLTFSGSTPYVAYSDVVSSNKTTVMKFDGTKWVNVGNPGFSAGYSIGQSLVFLNNIPFVAYIDSQNGGVSVLKFDIPSCIGSNNSIQVNTEGTYTVTVTNENGCSATSAPSIVTINPVPDVSATPSSQTVCSGNPITTIAFSGSVNGTSYNWTRDNGDLASGTVTGMPANGTGNINGTLTNTTGTDVTVSFTITATANGCIGTPVTATVLVKGSITISSPAVTQPTCTVSAGKIVVNATAGNLLEYSINGGITWSSSNEFNSLAPGSYNIQVRFPGNPACVSSYGSNPVVLVAATNCCTLTCPANIIANNKTGYCGAYVTYPAAVKSAGCGSATLTYSKASGSFFNVGVTTVTATASTGATCSFTITVKDVQKPVITGCPSNISVNAASGSCSKVVTFATSATDNCPGVIVTASPASGTAFPAGTTTVTITAKDASNNITTSTFTVTVKETVKPVISCPANITANTTSGLCTAIVNPGNATATDNCSAVTITSTRSDNKALTAVYPLGNTTITWKAKDASGNYASCQQKITVKDFEPPVISNASVSPSILWPADRNMKTITVNYTSVDNCSSDCTSGTTLTVTSNEPISGTYNGDLSPDWQIINNRTVKLRAERKPTGTGRIYTIKITSTDANANVSTKTVTVSVPIASPYSKGGEDTTVFTVTDNNNNEDLSNKLSVQVSPNPSSNYFNLSVKTGSTEPINIRVLDLAGRMVKQIKAIKGNSIRFGEDLIPGTYLLEVRQGDEKQVVKVIKL